jgi:hypothetical protein
MKCRCGSPPLPGAGGLASSARRTVPVTGRRPPPATQSLFSSSGPDLGKVGLGFTYSGPTRSHQLEAKCNRRYSVARGARGAQPASEQPLWTATGKCQCHRGPGPTSSVLVSAVDSGCQSRCAGGAALRLAPRRAAGPGATRTHRRRSLSTNFEAASRVGHRD